MTTAPPSDIDPFSANDTHVATEESSLPPRPVAVRSTEESLLPPRPVVPPRPVPAQSTEERLLPPRPIATRGLDRHAGNDKSLLPHGHDAAQPPINKTTTTTNDVPRLHDDLVGKDVILYAVLRSELPVAKGTVISTNPNTIVGGQPLGTEYCEVVVDIVMKKDAMLPRTYGKMQTMASAAQMNIAWPFNKVKECRKKACKKASRTPLNGTAECVGQSLT